MYRVSQGPAFARAISLSANTANLELFPVRELVGVEPATAVALDGGEHGHFNQYSHYVPCHRSSTLSDQHRAKQIVRVIVIIIGVLSLLKYLAIY